VALLLVLAVLGLLAWLLVPRRQPFQPRRPFGPRGCRPPSERLQAIARQRRAEHLANPTVPEQRFNEILRGLGFVEGRDYEREHVIFYPGSFCLIDFFFPSRGIAFEVDGSAHDSRSQQIHDVGRDAYLSGEGIRTCRIRNCVVMRQGTSCRSRILAETGFPSGYVSSLGEVASVTRLMARSRASL
jgi:very-short-patch-repair endonuclease